MTTRLESALSAVETKLAAIAGYDFERTTKHGVHFADEKHLKRRPFMQMVDGEVVEPETQFFGCDRYLQLFSIIVYADNEAPAAVIDAAFAAIRTTLLGPASDRTLGGIVADIRPDPQSRTETEQVGEDGVRPFAAQEHSYVMDIFTAEGDPSTAP